MRCERKNDELLTGLLQASGSKQRDCFSIHRLEAPLSPALASFFALVIDHTMQGFYGSPQYGGNRDEASWKMLAIEDVMEGHKH